MRVGTSIIKLTSGTAALASGSAVAARSKIAYIASNRRCASRAWHQRVARRVAEAGERLVPVGAELGVAEPFEDLRHHRTLRQPTPTMQVDLFADFGDPRPATLMGRLGGLVGAVHVGEHLPAPAR